MTPQEQITRLENNLKAMTEDKVMYAKLSADKQIKINDLQIGLQGAVTVIVQALDAKRNDQRKKILTEYLKHLEGKGLLTQ